MPRAPARKPLRPNSPAAPSPSAAANGTARRAFPTGSRSCMSRQIDGRSSRRSSMPRRKWRSARDARRSGPNRCADVARHDGSIPVASGIGLHHRLLEARRWSASQGWWQVSRRVPAILKVLAGHRASTSQPTAEVRASRAFLPASTRPSAPSSEVVLVNLLWRLYRLQSALALGRITPLIAAVVRATRSPDHDRYGESPAQAGRAVAADLPSGMGGEASRASGSTQARSASQSSAGSTARITFIDESRLVAANAHPANSSCWHPGGEIRAHP